MQKMPGSKVVTAALLGLLSPLLIVAAGSAAESQEAAPSAAVMADPSRQGLRGDYYISSGPGVFDFKELRSSVVDPNIAFADLNPVLVRLTGQPDNAAVRWTGFIQPEFSEAYTFSMIGDNGFRLWVNGQLLIDHWQDDWDVEQVSQPIQLAAGQTYDIKVEYFENVGGANLRLRWQSPSQAKAIVPPEAFSLPEGFDADDAFEWEQQLLSMSTPWTDDVSATNALPEYPRPQMTRQRWQNLNGVWQFDDAATGEAPPVGQELAERILVPYPVESALSGITRLEERMWYRRTFTVPGTWRVGLPSGQRLMLHFGAVDYDSKVWVNGTQVATHRGGYDKFSVDVTDALKGTGPQELIVWAEDLTDATWQPIGKQRQQSDRGIFYQGSSGIWQTVWMEPVARAHVGELEMTPDLDAAGLRLTTEASGAQGLRVEVTAYDGRRPVGTVTGPANTELLVPVPNAKLWSPDSPFLYDLRVHLFNAAGERVDNVSSYFGMREIGTARGADGKLRMTLNGKILFHMSTLDQGFWPDGLNTAPTDEALRFDLEQHKVLGFNTVRKHIKVEPDRWYYHADKLGLLVWQDMPASKVGRMPPEWQGQFEAELDEMLEEHDSWTSIVVWVPFNEGWGEWSREATGRIAEEVKTFDPSRLVNAHSGVNCCDSLGDSGKGDMIDFHQYVGPASPSPDSYRVSADGEHGGFGLRVPGHMWFGDYGHAYEMTPDKETLTRRYVENQRDVLKAANSCGISAAVYTQITDVEGEVNGFFTYDRRVEKMDFGQVRAINEQIIDSATGSADDIPVYPPGTPGLEGTDYWPLDEGSGTVARDQVRDYDLALQPGATWTSGRSASALQFDGSGGHAETAGPVIDTAGNFTVSAWVKLDRLNGWLTAAGQDGPVMSTFFLQKTGDSNRFSFSTAGGRALSTFRPVTGQWYHLVGVRDAASGVHSLYVDGIRHGSFQQCLNPESTGPLSVGRGRFNGDKVDFWPGSIDEVRVWDRALSAADIAALYATE
jgi:hypothetical protein